MKGPRLFRRTPGSRTSLHPPRMTSTSEAEHVTEWGRELGVHLRALRRLAGLSQGRLASIVGTSPPALSRLERGHVAKQVLLVIGVAQVITRALSRLDEMALREETQTLLRGLDTLAAGLPIGSSVRSRSWSTSIEMRRRRSDAACSRPHAPGARRLATPATRAPRSAARENCGPDRLRLQRVSHQHPGGNGRSLPRSDVPQGAAPSLRTSTSRVAEPSARPECSP